MHVSQVLQCTVLCNKSLYAGYLILLSVFLSNHDTKILEYHVGQDSVASIVT
jgi:hypothetical protein